MRDLIRPVGPIEAMANESSGVSVNEDLAQRQPALTESISLRWQALPFYGTRALAPIGMLWFEWWQICIALMVCSLFWFPIRTKFFNLRLAAGLSVLNNFLVCVPANAMVAVGFFLARAYIDASIAL